MVLLGCGIFIADAADVAVVAAEADNEDAKPAVLPIFPIFTPPPPPPLELVLRLPTPPFFATISCRLMCKGMRLSLVRLDSKLVRRSLCLFCWADSCSSEEVYCRFIEAKLSASIITMHNAMIKMRTMIIVILLSKLLLRRRTRS